MTIVSQRIEGWVRIYQKVSTVQQLPWDVTVGLCVVLDVIPLRK